MTGPVPSGVVHRSVRTSTTLFKPMGSDAQQLRVSTTRLTIAWQGEEMTMVFGGSAVVSRLGDTADEDRLRRARPRLR